MTKAPSEKRSKKKWNHAETFIEYFAVYHGSKSPNPGEEKLRILPYETITQLFQEYQASNKAEGAHFDLCAQRETFRKVWRDMHKARTVRFTRGKGTFPTCDICNNCNDLLSLSKSSHWTKHQREIVFNYKSMHLKQQAAERTALDAKKKIARESFDAAGMPMFACFLGDGMTIQVGTASPPSPPPLPPPHLLLCSSSPVLGNAFLLSVSAILFAQHPCALPLRSGM